MGRRKKTSAEKTPKRKAVKISIVSRMHAGRMTEPYQIMEERISSHRKDLEGVKIGIAWHEGWRPDADGMQTHGKAIKRTDLDRSLDGYDAIIEINKKSWAAFDDKQKRRLIAHELEHIQIAKDRNGTDVYDDKDRIVLRMKRHNIADFKSILDEFGTEIEPTAEEIADADRPLLQMGDKKTGNDGPPEGEGGEVPFSEDPLPEGKSEINVATGVPDVIRIPIKVKKMSLDAWIDVEQADGQPGHWDMRWSIVGGRKEAAGLKGDFATTQAAVEAGCKAIVEWLDSLSEGEYAFAGAAQKRVKDAVKKWIEGKQ